MVKESIIGQTKEYTMVNGKRINFMVMVGKNGLTVNNFKGNLEIIIKKDKGCFFGLMEKVMMVVGKIINNTEKQSLQIKKDKVKWVCGRTEKEYNG